MMTEAGGGGGGTASGGGGGGGAVVEVGGGSGGVGSMVEVEEGTTGGGTLLGGVVESGEWPEDCLLGVGGRGGMPLSDVESKLNEVEDEDVEEEEGAKRLGKYERLVVT